MGLLGLQSLYIMKLSKIELTKKSSKILRKFSSLYLKSGRSVHKLAGTPDLILFEYLYVFTSHIIKNSCSFRFLNRKARVKY